MRHPANETPEAAAFQGRPETEGAAEMQSPSRAAIAIFSVIFFFSGATALVYQIVWMRKLSLFFGSDVYSPR
jgi:hypothetical protein